jgi:hypothetical protein
MKIVYFSLLSLCAAPLTWGQTTKIAQRLGQSIPASQTVDNANRGFTIFEEDFAGGIPSDWSNTTPDGPVSWKYTTVGHTGAYPTASLNSETSNNGWVIVDSDADNFSGGGAEDARLMTPIIDCSGYSPVKIEFQQMFRRWQNDITTVRVTTDGGVNFTDFVINQAITQTGTDNPDYVNIDITAAIAGDPSNVQIMFWWQGAWDYGWQIDDFAIKEVDANDLILKRPAFSSGVAYYQVPQSQIQPLNFHGFVENIGFNAQTNVVMEVTVDNGSNVFSGTSNTVGSLAVGSTDSLGVVNSFTPSALGVHTVTYAVSQTETDDDLTNNTRTASFTITDTVYAIDNGIYGGQWWNQGDLNGATPYEIGAVYQIVNQTKTGTASVFIGDNSVVGSAFELLLYRFDAVAGTFVGVSASQTHEISAANLGAWVTLPWINYVTLTAGDEYLLTLKCNGGADEVYIGYGTNTSFRGYTVSNDGLGGEWSNQPRTPMLRMNFNELLSVHENNSIENVMVFPNPAQDVMSIVVNTVGQQKINYIITDVTGRVVSVNTPVSAIGTYTFTENVAGYESGVYFVTMLTETNSKTLSFVKK